jgi:hypothetical protein
MNQRITSYPDTIFLAPGSINYSFDVCLCLAFEILCATKYKAPAAEPPYAGRIHNCIVWFHSQLQSYSSTSLLARDLCFLIRCFINLFSSITVAAYHTLTTFFPLLIVALPSSTCLFTAGVEGFHFHLITLKHTPHSVGLLWTRDRPLAETST